MRDGLRAYIRTHPLAAMALQPDQREFRFTPLAGSGGKDEGPAGRPGEDFHAGYFRDLDDNKLSVLCME